jgi:predicted ATPase
LRRAIAAKDNRRVPRRLSSPQLIGRGDALEAVAQALERAAAGDPGLVIVAGEAGVGKTRLAREACARAADAGARVLWGGCVPLDAGELPYAPLVAALRPLSRELSQADDLLGPAREELHRLLPELGAAAAPAGPVTPTSRTRLFELLLGVLGRLAEAAPVVLVVEDIHWADGATRDLLRFLARNVDRERLLLIATHRTDDVAAPDTRLLDHLLRSDRAERIALDRLTREQTAEQVAGISGGTADDETADWAYERSEGNPFITEELVAARAAGDGAGVPDSLRAVLLSRTSDLTRDARRVLEVMATAGGALPHALLARATRLEEPALDDALHGLLRAHVIVCDAAGERCAFRHALMREALYGELLAPQRRARHGALADAIEEAAPAGARGPVEWAALAHHWDAAGDAPRALGAALAAADAAVRAYAFADARRQLERARELWPSVAPAARPPDVDEAELLRRLADAARLAGDSDGAIPIAEAALAALDPGEARRAARLHLLLGKLHHAVAPALAHLERALELLPDKPSEDRAAVLVGILGALNYGELPSVARERALEALAVARAAGAVAEEAVVHHRLGSILAYGGDAEAGLAHLREARRLCAELGRVDDMALALNDLGDALMLLGRIEDALVTFDEGLEDVRRAGLARAGGLIIELNAADCELRLGRWRHAAARLRRLRRLLRRELTLLPLLPSLPTSDLARQPPDPR